MHVPTRPRHHHPEPRPHSTTQAARPATRACHFAAPPVARSRRHCPTRTCAEVLTPGTYCACLWGTPGYGWRSFCVCHTHSGCKGGPAFSSARPSIQTQAMLLQSSSHSLTPRGVGCSQLNPPASHRARVRRHCGVVGCSASPVSSSSQGADQQQLCQQPQAAAVACSRRQALLAAAGATGAAQSQLLHANAAAPAAPALEQQREVITPQQVATTLTPRQEGLASAHGLVP